jgi:hypothetical protein
VRGSHLENGLFAFLSGQKDRGIRSNSHTQSNGIGSIRFRPMSAKANMGEPVWNI